MNSRIREIQIKAILARFKGDRDAAAEYCVQMMNAYPRLYTEYGQYLEALNYDTETKVMGAGA